MAIQVFLGNPSNRIMTWIKSKNEQQQNATIINNTNIWQDPNNYNYQPIPAKIMLSNDLTSYDIQPQNDVQVPVKAGTYYARINCPIYDNNDLYANAVYINNTWSQDLGFHDVYDSDDTKFINENYVIEENKTYEFTYGQKNL